MLDDVRLGDSDGEGEEEVGDKDAVKDGEQDHEGVIVYVEVSDDGVSVCETEQVPERLGDL